MEFGKVNNLSISSFFYFSVGIEYLLKKDKNGAKHYFQKSIEVEKVNWNSILTLFYLEEYKNGIKELEQLLSSEPSGKILPIRYLEEMLMYFHAALGNFKKVKYYRKLRSKRPPQRWFYVTDAYVAMKKGNQQQAVENLQKAYLDGMPFSIFVSDVDFMSLQGYPPFDEFMKPKG